MVSIYQPSSLRSIFDAEQQFVKVDRKTLLLEGLAQLSQINHRFTTSDNSTNLNTPIYCGNSCILIVEDNERLIGIITARDIVRMIAQKRQLKKLTVAQVMTHHPIACKVADLENPLLLIQVMHQQKFQHLPVVNEQYQPIAIVTPATIGDILQTADLLKLRFVEEIMSRQVIYASPKISIAKLAQRMTRQQVSSIVIVKKTRTNAIYPLGIITEQDLVQLAALQMRLDELRAERVITPLFTVKQKDSLGSAHQEMQTRRIRHLGVVNPQGELVGILTQTRILQAINLAEVQQVINALQLQVQTLKADNAQLLERANQELKQQLDKQATLLVSQADREKLLFDIALKIRSSLDLETILQTTVEEVRKHLQTNRVIIYRFETDWSGKVVVESVEQPQWSILHEVVRDECFEPSWLTAYQEQQSKAIADIYNANLSTCYIQFLENFKVRANLVIPILVDRTLWGLLAVHHCTEPRIWLTDEILFLERLCINLAIAIQQSNLLKQAQQTQVELELQVQSRTNQLQQELIERASVEAKVLERQEILRSFYDSSPMMMGVVELLDNDILHLFDNQFTANFFGTTPEALANKKARDLGVAEPALQQWITHYQQSRKLGKPVRFEYQHITLEKSYWLLAIVSYIGIAESGRPRFSYIVEDITEYKQIQAKYTRLSYLLDSSFNEIYVFDAETLKFDYVNQGALNNLGYSREEMRQKTPVDVKAITLEQFQEIIHPLVSKQQDKITFQTVHIRANGSQYPVEVHLQLSEYLGKQVFLAIILDISDRQRTENALKVAQARFFGILDIAKDAIISVDSQQRIIIFNQGAEKTFGYTAQEMIGQPLARLLPERFATAHDNYVASFADYKGSARRMGERGEIWGRRKNGEEFPAEASISKLTLDGETIFTTILRDVTQRKRDEVALSQLAALVNSSEDAIISKTLDGIVTSWNAAAEKLFGYTASEIIGSQISQIIPVNLRFEAENILDKIRQGQSVPTYETIRQRRDGSLINVALTVSPIRDRTGRIVGASKIVRDISEQQAALRDRKEAELALKESEERYRVLVSHAPVGIFQTDAEGKCVYVNPRWTEMTGLSLSEALGEGWVQALHPDDREQIFAEWVQATAEKRLFNLEYRFRKQTGVEVWVSGQAIAVRDETGAVKGYFGTVMDITARKQAEEKLRQSQTNLAEAQRIAHLGSWQLDLRTKERIWSDETFRIFGLDPNGAAPTQAAFLQMVHPDDRQQIQHWLQQLEFRLTAP
ncbi:PAS domain S-box protein [Aerosakkonema sp. BLCC-F183]|uniref:PAS domain S-box protein n=1 Tax=Aerosakkonema sp. BLCC-F183 TaxID=3342834 RepID=UPI0035B743F8